jgi:hypothetical protein
MATDSAESVCLSGRQWTISVGAEVDHSTGDDHQPEDQIDGSRQREGQPGQGLLGPAMQAGVSDPRHSPILLLAAREPGRLEDERPADPQSEDDCEDSYDHTAALPVPGTEKRREADRAAGPELLAFREWAIQDSNLGPLPYQIAATIGVWL